MLKRHSRASAGAAVFREPTGVGGIFSFGHLTVWAEREREREPESFPALNAVGAGGVSLF